MEVTKLKHFYLKIYEYVDKINVCTDKRQHTQCKKLNS